MEPLDSRDGSDSNIVTYIRFNLRGDFTWEEKTPCFKYREISPEQSRGSFRVVGTLGRDEYLGTCSYRLIIPEPKPHTRAAYNIL